LLAPPRRESRQKLQDIESQLFGADSNEGGSRPAAWRNEDEPQVAYDIDSAYQGLDAVEMVRKAFDEARPYAMVFMDVRMPPGIDGIETISRIWRDFPSVEMVICTAYSDYSHEQIVIKLGRTDRLLFLTKPFDSIAVKQMALSLSRKWSLHEEARRHVKRLEEEIAQRKRSERRLQFLINHDPLTGLANRVQLQAGLEEAVAQARRRATRFALFFVDLDRFKEVIDTLGYQHSERLIRQIADRLKARLEPRAAVYCPSGDEFAVLLPEIASEAHAAEMAREIHQALEPYFDLDGLNVEVKPNVGIVLFPDHGSNIDMLMRHADIALMQARKAEQGYRFFHRSMNRFSHERLMLLSDLRQAIGRDELLLYYQPTVDLRLGKAAGVEALLRWPHPQHGFISPSEFIPLAERCGLIRHLTRWSLGELARQWSIWRERGVDLKASLNLTALDLQNAHLPAMISEAAAELSMPVECLGFEISEKALMTDPDQAIETLRKIRDLGAQVVIDKFGRGFSSLAYLKAMPVSQIKIDRTFVSELGRQGHEVAIVRSMIELIHNLGMEASAEGADNRLCFETLQNLGCDYVQGSVVNNPAPAGELALWLEQSDFAALPAAAC